MGRHKGYAKRNDEHIKPLYLAIVLFADEFAFDFCSSLRSIG